MMISNPSRVLSIRLATISAASLLLGACATSTGGSALAIGQQASMKGQIVSVDTAPWTYDGSAVVKVSTANGNIDVHLPARWNLCKAPPPDDVQSLKPGDRVTVTGTVTETSSLVVCERPEHGLRKAP